MSQASSTGSNPLCAPVLRSLLSRNNDWTSSIASRDPSFLPKCASGQSPKVLWVGCADSRVPESVVCEAMPGEIFTHRNIANQFNHQDDSAVSVLTYAVEALGVEHGECQTRYLCDMSERRQTHACYLSLHLQRPLAHSLARSLLPVIIVGHTTCGGINAAIAGSSAPISSDPAPSALGRYLTPLVRLARSVSEDAQSEGSISPTDLARRVTEENIKQQMRNVLLTECLRANWKGEKAGLSGKVMQKVCVHGWVFDLQTGKLKDLECSVGPPREVGGKPEGIEKLLGKGFEEYEL